MGRQAEKKFSTPRDSVWPKNMVRAWDRVGPSDPCPRPAWVNVCIVTKILCSFVLHLIGMSPLWNENTWRNAIGLIPVDCRASQLFVSLGPDVIVTLNCR